MTPVEQVAEAVEALYDDLRRQGWRRNENGVWVYEGDDGENPEARR